MKATTILSSGIHAARPKKINKHIEIVSSTVSGLGSMNKQSRDAVYDVLTDHYSKVGITIVNKITDLEALSALRPDLVFLGMKYVPIDPNNLRGHSRIWLTSYLDELGIAYTGSGQSAHELELDKSLAKQRVVDFNLKTSPFYVARQNKPHAKQNSLSFPMFVKPTDRGSGHGIDSSSVVRGPVALQLKIDSISANLQADSLVEEYLPGREFSVAILKKEYVDGYEVMPIELLAPADSNGNRILSSAVKAADSESFIEIFDTGLKDQICELAIKVFKALGARDYGRIDIRLDQRSAPHFLEANLIPSLINGFGNFPKACLLNIKLDYEDMILAIVALGFAREYIQPDMNLLGDDPDEILNIELASTVPTA